MVFVLFISRFSHYGVAFTAAKYLKAFFPADNMPAVKAPDFAK